MMECHDVRLLMTFQRGCENLDAAEHAALQQHLEKCPECASLTQAEQRLDQALGQLMRDVPVPADLKQKVLHRLAAERGQSPWKSVLKWTLAAGLVVGILAVVIGGGYLWYSRAVSQILVTPADIEEYVNQRGALTSVEVEAIFKKKGLDARVPPAFDCRLLDHIDVVQFKGRRVPKLTFANPEKGAVADVLILSARQFRTEGLQQDNSVRIEHEGEFIYLICPRGNLADLQRPVN
jgi:hypothetical protein